VEDVKPRSQGTNERITRSLSITRSKEGLARNLNQVQDVVAGKEIHSPDSRWVALSVPLSQGLLKGSHFQRLPELELEGYVHVIEYREETEAQKGYPLGTHTYLLTPQTRSRPSQWHSIHPCYPK
jgi:hypothetical protein